MNADIMKVNNFTSIKKRKKQKPYKVLEEYDKVYHKFEEVKKQEKDPTVELLLAEK